MHQSDSNTLSPAGKTWLAANQVRSRYGGISSMTLWRWLNDPEFGFPKPRYINRRRYWLEEELDAFDAVQVASTEDA